MADAQKTVADILGIDEDDVFIFITPPEAMDAEFLARHEELHRNYWLLMVESPSNSVH